MILRFFDPDLELEPKICEKPDLDPDSCYRYLHRPKLLRQAQEKDGNSGQQVTNQQQ